MVPLRSYVGQSVLPVQTGSALVRPKRIWICPGDIYRGASNTSDGGWGEDTPYWWFRGSSYMYPGPHAYLSPSTRRPLDLLAKDESIKPRKPFQWRNHKRDILLADYWFDFHTGRRVAHQDAITPPAWVNQLDVKGIAVLFLDCHVKSVTPGERQKYVDFTVKTDNPHYVRPKP